MFVALNDTIGELSELIKEIGVDLGKAHRGNKSAAQRVRVFTIDLEKVSKKYRKESVAAEKRHLKKAQKVKKRVKRGRVTF